MSVFTAIRLLPTEQSNNEWVATSSKTIAFENKEHVFDHVFSSHNNIEVYDLSCRLIVERVVEGYNGTIAAYGQSGAGKTHSLLGTDREKGVLQLAVSNLLKLINERTSVQYMVKLSAFEIYNENLIDLLDDRNSKNCRIIGEKVVGGVEEIVESEEHFLRICQKAQDRRSVGETHLNQKSSRSHAVFQLIVESCQVDDITRKQSTTVSKLVVLDLAGSENARTMTNATQTAESRKINLSLLALSRVISDLADNPTNKCTTFRDSLLTRILKPVLGGNSQFLLLCCIRKTASSETASTISFGQKAKKMPNHAEKNVETGDAALPALLAQISDLKRQLEQQKKETAGQDKQRLEELLKKVLNSEPEAEEKKAPFPVAKRRHSIAFGASLTSISDGNRHARLSMKEKWCDRFLIAEEPENEMEIIKETVEENQKMEFEDLEEKENVKVEEGTTRMLIEDLENHKKKIEVYEKELIEEKEKSKILDTKLAEMEKTARRWKQKTREAEEKYADMKRQGLAILEKKNDRIRELEDQLAQKDLEHEEVAQKLLDEKLKRQKAKQEMHAASQLVKKALEEEKQLRKEAEIEHLTERSERKALQEKLQDMTVNSRGTFSGTVACSVLDHAHLINKCDVLVRQRELLIASLNERTGGHEDNYDHELPTTGRN